MGVREIPKSWEFVCDACARLARADGEQRPHNGVPEGWVRSSWRPNMGRDRESLLCGGCATKVAAILGYKGESKP